MGLLIADPGERLIRIGNHRRTLVRPHRRHGIHHICDQIGIRDHDLLRLIAPQILEFLKHFLRGTQIKRRLIVRILIFSRGHDDPAVYLILRIQKMHVAGGHHRFVEGLSEFHYFSV